MFLFNKNFREDLSLIFNIMPLLKKTILTFTLKVWRTNFKIHIKECRHPSSKTIFNCHKKIKKEEGRIMLYILTCNVIFSALSTSYYDYYILKSIKVNFLC